jgi:hypothetical protein
MRLPVLIGAAGALAVMTGCSGPTQPPELQQPEFKKRSDAPVGTPVHDHTVTVRDQSRMLPPKGLKHSGIVMDHVAGIPKLPGGTVGDYSTGAKTYQIFIVDAETNQQAAFLLLDAKGVLQNPEYLSSFGGYFGLESGRPVFVFAKDRYLTGIVGLPQAEADPLARTLASRLK